MTLDITALTDVNRRLRMMLVAQGGVGYIEERRLTEIRLSGFVHIGALNCHIFLIIQGNFLGGQDDYRRAL